MADLPTLVFIPGSWHKPSCYHKIIQPLQDNHSLKCIPVTLPSTTGDPNATFKDDIGAARDAIEAETNQGRNVIVIAHSYGGMVGNSAIRGFTRPRNAKSTSSQNLKSGHVVALVLIASGFTITGLAFMDPFFGIPPPQWRVNKDTGYAEIVIDPREFFYHDLPEDEAKHWVSELTTQSLKSLFEGGEHAYAGWKDVPSWYIGTVEDKGLPVLVQRIQVGAVRAQGAVIHHYELKTSHSPFLSQPDKVVEIIMEVVAMSQAQTSDGNRLVEEKKERAHEVSMVKFGAPATWFTHGIPYLFGRVIGWSILGFWRLRRPWTR